MLCSRARLLAPLLAFLPSSIHESIISIVLAKLLPHMYMLLSYYTQRSQIKEKKLLLPVIEHCTIHREKRKREGTEEGERERGMKSH
jgi:hypothetical protein